MLSRISSHNHQPHGRFRLLRSLDSPPLNSGVFQLEGITLLFVIELPHKLNEQMLQFGQPLATSILQVRKVMLEGTEPFLHLWAVLDEGSVTKA
jgi:hypothetical protein